MDKIRIDGLEIFCNHGVYQEETVLGQKFLVDVEMFLSARKAGLSDELEDSVSYGEVCRLIDREMKRQNDKLLERVAERLAQKILLSFPLIEKVRIEVKKPWAPLMMHVNYASVTIERGWHQVYVGVGSNMGDRMAYIRGAEKKLSEDEQVRNFRAASVVETEPWGYEEQPSFLNTVFCFSTLYEPEELLNRLWQIEREADRVREIHWGPRTLDLDLLFYDSIVMEEEHLVIPHPEIERRMFVLEPLCELAPQGVHPLSKKRFLELKEELSQKENVAHLEKDRL